MCDFADKLTAWIDGELAAGAAADTKRHLQLCAQCRDRVRAYREVSGAFEAYCEAYCDAVAAVPPRRKGHRRALAAAGAAGVAAAVALLLLFAPRERIRLLPARLPAPVTRVTTSGIVSQPASPLQAPQAPSASASISAVPQVQRRHETREIRQAAPQPRFQERNWPPTLPSVEIAIPAEAIFPPGAIPDGVGFTAEVTIAPDGSAQQIRLRPQLTEFERRPTRP